MRYLKDIEQEIITGLIGGVVRIKQDRVQRHKMPPDPEVPMTAVRLNKSSRGIPEVLCYYFVQPGIQMRFVAAWDVLELVPAEPPISRAPIDAPKRDSAVVLKSGGPTMVVRDVSSHGISCWWPGRAVTFPPSSLFPAIALRFVK
ncbi:hypothetical protein [Burkholderia gladioli]|uniref:hypothetical protein n=1 Tax=Burkholderia gladioli TaxID=28095 RepID=UPI00164023DD|nr:hypothetical protein [Burkholderia gladioli]